MFRTHCFHYFYFEFPTIFFVVFPLAYKNTLLATCVLLCTPKRLAASGQLKCSARIVSTTFILNSPLYFLWYSLWHTKTPYLLDSIPYCLTNGVRFTGALLVITLLIAQASEREKAFFIVQLSSKRTLSSVSAARAFSSLAMASLASVRRAARRAGSASWACFSS